MAHSVSPPSADAGTATLTVAIVREPDVRQAPDAIVARLSELAVNDELVVVYGSHTRPQQPISNAVVDGLRERLPRYTVVGLNVAPDAAPLIRTCALLDEFMEIGSLPVVVAPAPTVVEVATELAAYLRADRMVQVSN
jgi:hypothetical protein